MNEIKSELVEKHYYELISIYPGLILEKKVDDCWRVSGILKFEKSYNEVIIGDEYAIEIYISQYYPHEPPVVFERGNRIPRDFHKLEDNALCLGAPLELRMKFSQTPTLLAFVDNFVIPYLYSYSYFEKYGSMPFGELSHGGKGILEYYFSVFDTNDIELVKQLLTILSENRYRGHHICPCGSGLKIRKCHGKKLLEIMKYQTPNGYKYDLSQINYFIDNLHLKNKPILPPLPS